MSVQEKLTFANFEQFIVQPENENRLFEFIDGEIIEVSPGQTRNSGYPHIISFAARNFCLENQIPCFISGADGAYRVGENVVVPDFAFKRTPLSNDYPDPIAQEWVVEVISPTDKANEIRKKREIYQKAGILYWEMYPEFINIDIYEPGKPMRTLGIDDVLDGGAVLPGFKLAVKKLFEQ
jgi:Uma2 family endonuclease